MGAGDDVIASGFARGAASRGKRVAFGDGTKIIWGPHSKMVLANNPNVLSPGMEKSSCAEWVRYHKGHRVYNSIASDRSRWVWNYDFRVKTGEIFFSDAERCLAESIADDFVLVEPNVPNKSGPFPNKQWAADRFQAVVDDLSRDVRVIQLEHSGTRQRLRGAEMLPTKTFRDALMVLSRAMLFIGAEGGMHHGAAAVGTPAIVLFGGWIPASTMGYEGHVNLTGGADESCGLLKPCDHCAKAMKRISVDEVLENSRRILSDNEVRDQHPAG